VLIGEIGGTEEQEAAQFLRQTGIRKPIVALVAGRHAPPERRMGHAGTLTMRDTHDAESKIEVLRSAGVQIASSAHVVGASMRSVMQGRERGAA
jgi:succinyl-CoA synthetase alpha subunit